MSQDFSVEAVLETRVSERSLRQARERVESELGDLEVDVTASVDGAGGGGGRASRDRAMSRRLESKQLDHLRSVVGTGEEGLELDEQRNTYLAEILETMEESAYTRATDGDGDTDKRRRRKPGGGAPGAFGAIAAALATLVGSQVPSPEDIKIPDIVPPPAPVKTPNRLPRGPGPTPGSGTGRRSPGGDGGDGFTVPEVGIEEVIGGLSAGAAAKWFSDSSQISGGKGNPASVFAGVPAAVATGAARDSQTQPRRQQSWLEKVFGDAFQSAGVGGGGASPAAFINMQSVLETGQNAGSGGVNNAAERRRQRRAAGGAASVDVSVTLEGATKREVERAMDQAKKEAVREISDGIAGRTGGGLGSGSGRLTQQ